MQIWLMSENKKERLRLPVLPASWQNQSSNNNTTVDITSFGELNLIGKTKLKEISIETFFPAHKYDFCQYKTFPSPYACVKLVEKWRVSGKPIRLLITDTTVNMAASIETFDYGEQDGTGDVYFTLDLKEYRYTTVHSVTTAARSKSKSTRQTKAKVKTYVVKKGDTLLSIAKKATGSSSNYKAIAVKNGVKNTKKLKVGQKLVIP